VLEKRIFTVEEANALIPALELHLTAVMRLRPQLRAVYQELEALGAPPTEESLRQSGGPPEVAAKRGRFRALAETLSEALGVIDGLGVAVKDLDLGLCDFLGVHEGREVWLCWQFGEKQVAFWHDLDKGFAQRKPLGASASRDAASLRVLH
jgi:hypothetical protein